MRRLGLGGVAVVTAAGWLAASALLAAQDGGNGRLSPNLEGVSSPWLKSGTSRAQVPPSLRLPEASAVNGVRSVAVASAPPAHKSRPSPLIGLYVSYGLLQALDGQLTVRALNSGSAHEGNPVLSPFAEHPAALATFKLVVTGATIYGFDRLYKSHHRLAMIGLATINGGYACIVIRTYRSFPHP